MDFGYVYRSPGGDEIFHDPAELVGTAVFGESPRTRCHPSCNVLGDYFTRPPSGVSALTTVKITRVGAGLLNKEATFFVKPSPHELNTHWRRAWFVIPVFLSVLGAGITWIYRLWKRGKHPT